MGQHIKSSWCSWCISLFCVISACSWGLSSGISTHKDIPILTAMGNNYQVGYNVGKAFKDVIRQYYMEQPYLRSVWLPWSHTPKGQQVVNGLLTSAKKYLPQYVTEVAGMADGADLPFLEVFLANHYVELYAFFRNESHNEPESCSDILVNSPQHSCQALGHNEDNIPLIDGKAYFLNATIIDDQDQVLEQFTAFCYPGQLPGNAFGFNHHGVVTTVNALYPTTLQVARVGRAFLTRAMLVAPSFEAAVKTVEQTTAAYGFSLNLGVLPQSSKDLPELYNIEVLPNSSGAETIMNPYKLHPGDKSCYFHVNMYRRLKTEEILSKIKSSVHRTRRIREFPPPTSLSDVRVILGDTADKTDPIYRRPSLSDNETTLATAMYDLRRCTLSIYVDNPKTSKAPQRVMSLTTCHSVEN